jgi:hypothetical protein
MLSTTRREPSRGRGINPRASWCDHKKPPLIVNPTETGSYYARCIGCLQIGPERPTSEAALQALQVLGASSDSMYKGVGASKRRRLFS